MYKHAIVELPKEAYLFKRRDVLLSEWEMVSRSADNETAINARNAYLQQHPNSPIWTIYTGMPKAIIRLIDRHKNRDVVREKELRNFIISGAVKKFKITLKEAERRYDMAEKSGVFNGDADIVRMTVLDQILSGKMSIK